MIPDFKGHSVWFRICDFIIVYLVFWQLPYFQKTSLYCFCQYRLYNVLFIYFRERSHLLASSKNEMVVHGSPITVSTTPRTERSNQWATLKLYLVSIFCLFYCVVHYMIFAFLIFVYIYMVFNSVVFND